MNRNGKKKQTAKYTFNIVLFDKGIVSFSYHKLLTHSIRIKIVFFNIFKIVYRSHFQFCC
jgi:hypothetical protein